MQSGHQRAGGLGALGRRADVRLTKAFTQEVQELRSEAVEHRAELAEHRAELASWQRWHERQWQHQGSGSEELMQQKNSLVLYVVFSIKELQAELNTSNWKMQQQRAETEELV